MTMAKILVAEDNHYTGMSVKLALENEKHTVELVNNGQDALNRLQAHKYAVAVIDIGLPEVSGYDVCRSYRAGDGRIPILILTGLSDIQNKEEGFGSGADDYLTKPFDVRELIMRVNALMRRPKDYQEQVISVRELVLNSRLRIAKLDDQLIDLRPKEFELLEFFMTNTNQFFKIEDLYQELWSSDSDSTEHAVRKCLSRLREKIHIKKKGSEEHHSFIDNSKGMGYKFVK